MKKQTSLTGKQIDQLNKAMAFGWILSFLGICLLVSWSMAIDTTCVSKALFFLVFFTAFGGLLAWWYKNSR